MKTGTKASDQKPVTYSNDVPYTFKKFREYDTILFRNGYIPDSPTMEVEWKETRILKVLEEPKNAFERYGFVIDLGKALGVENFGERAVILSGNETSAD